MKDQCQTGSIIHTTQVFVNSTPESKTRTVLDVTLMYVMKGNNMFVANAQILHRTFSRFFRSNSRRLVFYSTAQPASCSILCSFYISVSLSSLHCAFAHSLRAPPTRPRPTLPAPDLTTAYLPIDQHHGEPNLISTFRHGSDVLLSVLPQKCPRAADKIDCPFCERGSGTGATKPGPA